MNALLLPLRQYRRGLLITIAAGLLFAMAVLAVRWGLDPVSAASPSVNPNANQTGPLPKLSAQSSSAEVIALMLDSQNQWHSIDLAATTIWYAAGDMTTVTTTIQIQQPAQARVEGQQSFVNGTPSVGWTWVSDGTLIYEADSAKMIYTSHPLPEYAQSPEAYATAVSASGGDMITRQPLAILMPTGLGVYVYPSGLAQRRGTATVEGTDTLAGRPVVIVHWDGTTGVPARYWVDAGTGLILGAETYGGDGPNGASEETRATRVAYDSSLAPATFAFQPPPGEKSVTYAEWQGPAPR